MSKTESRVTESQWTRDLCLYLTSKCGCLIKPEVITSPYHQPGWPDRWLCCAVWTGWLEFKGKKTRVMKDQTARMKQIWERNPGGVYVVREGKTGKGGLVESWGGVICAEWRHPEDLLLELSSLTSCYIQRREDNALIMRNALYQRKINNVKAD